jgi:hypothetical protein
MSMSNDTMIARVDDVERLVGIKRYTCRTVEDNTTRCVEGGGGRCLIEAKELDTVVATIGDIQVEITSDIYATRVMRVPASIVVSLIRSMDRHLCTMCKWLMGQ